MKIHNEPTALDISNGYTPAFIDFGASGVEHCLARLVFLEGTGLGWVWQLVVTFGTTVEPYHEINEFIWNTPVEVDQEYEIKFHIHEAGSDAVGGVTLTVTPTVDGVQSDSYGGSVSFTYPEGWFDGGTIHQFISYKYGIAGVTGGTSFTHVSFPSVRVGFTEFGADVELQEYTGAVEDLEAYATTIPIGQNVEGFTNPASYVDGRLHVNNEDVFSNGLDQYYWFNWDEGFF